MSLAYDYSHPGIAVYRALTNKELDEEEKAAIVAEAIDSIAKAFPNLGDAATNRELSETELRLTKEIEQTRKEIKELDVRLTKEIADTRKEIKELDVKLTREIKEIDVKLGQTKVEIIKWVVGLLFAQSALIVSAIKFLS